jgi:hypothetical protein
MKTELVKNYSLPVCSYRGKSSDIEFPCFWSVKRDGELEYIIKKGSKVFTVNKSKYGRYRKNFPALDEFISLSLPDGIYLAELCYEQGRTKEDFYRFLSNKVSDNLHLFLWGILQLQNRVEVTASETYNFFDFLKPKVEEMGFFHLIEYGKIESESMLRMLIKDTLMQGFEGIVLRTPGSVYREGQRRDWIKVKDRQREINQKNKNGKTENLKLETYGVWV